ncbi:MAG: hypothetical protein EBS30_15540, partial [Planctomycetes bacterium]|nr:hypothetical protein [Planctomycetota bacterium]
MTYINRSESAIHHRMSTEAVSAMLDVL